MFDADRQHRHNRTSPASPGAWTDFVPKLLLSISVLTLALTGSFIAWERFGQAEPVAVAAGFPSAVADHERAAVLERLSTLSEETRALRVELDGIVGPGGVLSRMVERLQEGHRNDVAHRAAIDQLLVLVRRQGVLSGSAGREDPAAVTGPVEVTPIRTDGSSRPVHVIVTPSDDPAPPEVQDE